MPGHGRSKQTPRQQRDEFVEDLITHLTDAAGEARLVGGLLDDDQQNAAAREWAQFAQQIEVLVKQAQKMAR